MSLKTQWVSTMGNALLKRLKKLEPLIKAASGRLEPTVYGVVDRVDNVDGVLVPNIIRRWVGTVGNMVLSDEEPTVLLVPKLEPFILKHKKYKASLIIYELIRAVELAGQKVIKGVIEDD